MREKRPIDSRHPGVRALLGVIALLLSIVVSAPIILSAGELMRWTRSITGLALEGTFWQILVVGALDAAAVTCLLVVFVCAILNRSPGPFKILAWVFPLGSAAANYQVALAPGAGRSAWWFFPAMSILGPTMLEATAWIIRRAVQEESGERSSGRPKFGIIRWLPLVGSPKDTYGAYRTAMILQIPRVEDAIARYHQLCPDGSVKVVRAIRALHAADAREEQDKIEAELTRQVEVAEARAHASDDRARGTARATRARKDARASTRARAPRKDARARTARTDDAVARAHNARTDDNAHTPDGARAPGTVDDLYARYAARVDQAGEEMTTDDISDALGVSDGHARRVRGQLAARYAEEFTARTRTPRDGVTLPPRVQTAIAARARSVDVTGEFARIADGVA